MFTQVTHLLQHRANSMFGHICDIVLYSEFHLNFIEEFQSYYG